MTTETNKETEVKTETQTQDQKHNNENEALDYWKGQAQKAFEARQAEREKAKQLEEQLNALNEEVSSTGKAKKEQLAQQLETVLKEKEELQKQINMFNSEKAVSKKQKAVMEELKKQGIKDRYVENQSALQINYDAVDLEQEYSIKLEVKRVKELLPDLFNSVTDSIPSPKLGSGNVSYKDEIDKLMKSGKFSEAQELIDESLKVNPDLDKDLFSV